MKTQQNTQGYIKKAKVGEKMDILIAMQAIYDKNFEIYAYELLYRSSVEINEYTETNGDIATSLVIVGTMLGGGIENMTDQKIGFINFTDNMLKSDLLKLMPPRHLGIEILETAEPTEDALDACRKLRDLGHKITLDDYVLNGKSHKFAEYADIIKVDFLNSDDRQIMSIVKKYKRKGVKFIAEKIETEEDYDKAQKYGFDYFQGYYLSKPSYISCNELMELQTNAK